MRGANEAEVIDRLDRILAPYGGTGAYGRKDQISDAFLDSELTQLAAMARVIPPIFLFVSAFLINMILSRLIALEREQIGLLKALGYRPAAIACALSEARHADCRGGDRHRLRGGHVARPRHDGDCIRSSTPSPS